MKHGEEALPRAAWPDHAWVAALQGLLERFEGEQVRSIRRRVAGGAKGRVLEIGAGTGTNLRYYNWSAIDELVASEPDHNMFLRLQARREKLPAEAREKVRLHWAAAESLDLEGGDSSFDTIVATLVLCSVYDPARALAEARRLLKPGGELRFFEHVAAPGLLGTVQGALQPLWGRVAGGCQLRRETEAALRAAGFEVEVEERRKLAPWLPAIAGVARTRG